MNVGIGTFPLRRAQVRPEDVAWEYEGTERSYGEVAERVTRLANALLDAGVRRGDRVAYLGFNHPALLETFFATNLLGAASVLINPRLTAPEVGFIVDDAGASVVVHGAEQRAVVAALAGGDVTANLGAATSADADGTAAPADATEAAPPGPTRRAWWAAEGSPVVGGTSLEERLANASSDPVDADVADDDLALIMYTSGTTGRPKGAMLTHRNLTYQYLNALLSTDVRQDEVHLAVAPLFHIAGLNMMTLPSFMLGGRLLIQRTFRPADVLAQIQEGGVTSAFMVPAMIDALASDESFAATDLASLRSIMVGGSPLPERSIRVWSERGVKIMQGFGMTETAPGVCLLESRDALAKAGTAGRPHFFSEVRVVDLLEGSDVGAGAAGEVWVRGPQVMSGYWNRPDATASALEGGWYRTGDIAVRDAEGYFTIKDRIKDMYISGGENVYPAEVENALLNVPGVLDAAVVGVPDARWGESGRAYVVVAEGHDDPAALRTALARRLARYKLPRDVVVVDELPRTTTGKIQKNLLRRGA